MRTFWVFLILCVTPVAAQDFSLLGDSETPPSSVETPSVLDPIVEEIQVPSVPDVVVPAADKKILKFSLTGDAPVVKTPVVKTPVVSKQIVVMPTPTIIIPPNDITASHKQSIIVRSYNDAYEESTHTQFPLLVFVCNDNSKSDDLQVAVAGAIISDIEQYMHIAIVYANDTVYKQLKPNTETPFELLVWHRSGDKWVKSVYATTDDFQMVYKQLLQWLRTPNDSRSESFNWPAVKSL